MTSPFTVALRGYDRVQVDRLLIRVDAAIGSGDEALQASTRDLLREPGLTIVLRGYALEEVDLALEQRLNRLGSATPGAAPAVPTPTTFTVVLQGYDRGQVDDVFAQADAAMLSDDPFVRAAARDALRAAGFTVGWRGYARDEVDQAVRVRLQRLA